MVLAFLGPLHLQISFRISSSIPAKKAAGILIVIPLYLYINLESIGILMTVSLPIYEREIYFHLFKSSLISFKDVL